MSDFIHEPPKDAAKSPAPNEEKPVTEHERLKKVYTYVAVLFAVAFLLILWTFLMSQRSSEEMLHEIGSGNDAMQNVLEENELLESRNAELEKLADGEQVFYIDCNPVFDDETGALRADYSGDGVHVKAAHYVEWRDYLFTFGVVRDAKTEAVTAADKAPAAPED